MNGEIVTANFDLGELSRINALAEVRSISRDEMIRRLIQTGLVVCEQEDAPPVSHSRFSGAAS